MAKEEEEGHHHQVPHCFDEEEDSMLLERYSGSRPQRGIDEPSTPSATKELLTPRARFLWAITGTLVFAIGLIPFAMEEYTMTKSNEGETTASKPFRYIAEPQPLSPPPPCTEANGQTFYDFFERYKQGGPLVHKWVNYFPVYERHFGRYVGQNFTFVEVGVENGGSILMWKHFFGHKMKYIGIDINPQTQELNSPEYDIEVVIGDAENRGFWREFKETHPVVDVFMDDGGHTQRQQIVAFEEMYPHVAPDGIYACEDIHTSYFGGQYKGNPKPSQPLPKDKRSFVEYTKTFIDLLHKEHFTDPELENLPITETLVGMHYYDSIMVLDKGVSGTTHELMSGDRIIPPTASSYDGTVYDWKKLFKDWVK